MGISRVLRATRLLRSDKRSVTAVEFALVVPTFLVLLFVVFEVSYDLFMQEVLDNALQSAARQVQIGNTQTASNSTFVNNFFCPYGDGLLNCNNLFSADSVCLIRRGFLFEISVAHPRPAIFTMPRSPACRPPAASCNSAIFTAAPARWAAAATGTFPLCHLQLQFRLLRSRPAADKYHDGRLFVTKLSRWAGAQPCHLWRPVCASPIFHSGVQTEAFANTSPSTPC